MHLAADMHRRKAPWRLGRTEAAVCAILLFPSVGLPQTSGSPAAAAAGGVLGLASGATLAFAGSVVPCAQSRPGPACVRWSAAGGGALGLTGGALLGASDAAQLGDAAVGAGIGFLAGSVGGLILKSRAERFGWTDVAAVGLFGGAIGAVPLGSAIGLLGGSAIGLVTWSVVDAFRTPDLIGAAALGMAVGGLAEWLVRGIDAGTSDGPAVSFVLPLSLGR